MIEGQRHSIKYWIRRRRLMQGTAWLKWSCQCSIMKWENADLSAT